jgi:hypothetical protein
MATHSKRKNSIKQIHLVSGEVLTQHEEKAEAIFAAFKNRLGKSEYHHMYFDLDDLLHHYDLPQIDNPFSPEEIKDALLDMTTDHAPGPDGFNGMFMKKC